jgi:integrase/recombinase XerC
LSTIRGYHLALRMFCDYLIDSRYEWARPCRDRFKLFDYLDDRVDRIATMGRKGSASAYASIC